MLFSCKVWLDNLSNKKTKSKRLMIMVNDHIAAQKSYYYITRQRYTIIKYNYIHILVTYSKWNVIMIFKVN